MDLLTLALFLIGLSLFGMDRVSPGLYLSSLGLGALAGAVVLFATESYPAGLAVLVVFTAASLFYQKGKHPEKKALKKKADKLAKKVGRG